MFYLYDQAGQLTMELNNSTGNGWQYTYDAGGNILTKRKVTQGVPESTNASTYTYGNAEWKDLLTAYNGSEITYDAAGNPLSYYNGFNFEWTMGRQLASVQRPGISAVSYTYNSDGLRTSKTVGNNTIRYTWIGDKVTSEVGNGNALYFYYDSNNTPVAVMLNGTIYYYVTNLQGDIIAMLDETGTAVVEYTYDAWGKTTVTGMLKNTVGRINPLRYRGYYYDSDVGLYYLQSRYYDSEIGRFINADEPEMILARGVTNLFGYCGNDPVNCTDCTGRYRRLKGRTRRNFDFFMRLPLNIGAESYLRKKGWNYSADFLVHALKNNPSDLYYDCNSDLSKRLRKTNQVRRAFSKYRKKRSNDEGSMIFAAGDFMGALHGVSYYIYRSGNNRRLMMRITDTYDFKYEWNYYGNMKVVFANNYAYITQIMNALKPYDITIDVAY